MKHPIIQFREANGLTLEGFANLVGVSKSAVSKWQKGVGPSLNLARQIEGKTKIPKEMLRPDVWPNPEIAA